MKLKHFILASGILIFACQGTKIDSKTYSRIRQNGDKVSNQAQATLLNHVAEALKKGGPEYAIGFCNLMANSIIDSLNEVNNCTIKRVSDRNRNEGNALKTDTDKSLWKIFDRGTLTDTVVKSGDYFVYYKVIRTALPACLKCHGNTETDLSPATHNKLLELYPNDKATGYKLNEFRGLWKIEFEDR